MTSYFSLGMCVNASPTINCVLFEISCGKIVLKAFDNSTGPDNGSIPVTLYHSDNIQDQ